MTGVPNGGEGEPQPSSGEELTKHSLALPKGIEVPGVSDANSVEIETAPVKFVRVTVKFDENGVPIVEKAENGEYLLPEAGRVCVDGRTSRREAMIRTGAYGAELETIIAFVEYLKELGISPEDAARLMPYFVNGFFNSLAALGVRAYMHTDDHAGEDGIGCGHFATNAQALPEKWQRVAKSAYNAAKKYAKRHPNTLTNEVLQGEHGEAMVLMLDESAQELAVAREITITTADGEKVVKQAFVNNPTINAGVRYVHAAILYRLLMEAEGISDEVKGRVGNFETFRKRLEEIAAVQRSRTNERLVARNNLPVLTVKRKGGGPVLEKPNNLAAEPDANN